MIEKLEDIISYDNLPHKWCPGCGHGTIVGNLGRAITKLGIDNEEIVVVSGIGCSGRAAKFFDTYSVHTTHGRPIAFATGLKLANPKLKVIVLTGDGDCAAIGGNHFIHGCRRNIDLTVIVFNNGIYGMTGGQGSPSSPANSITTTTPYGSLEAPFDICKLSQAAGATYIARGMTANASSLSDLFIKGLQHTGFSVIDVITQCTTHYGRRNDLRSARQMLEFQKTFCFLKSKWEKQDAEMKKKSLPIGVLHHEESIDFQTRYKEMCEREKMNEA